MKAQRGGSKVVDGAFAQTPLYPPYPQPSGIKKRDSEPERPGKRRVDLVSKEASSPHRILHQTIMTTAHHDGINPKCAHNAVAESFFLQPLRTLDVVHTGKLQAIEGIGHRLQMFLGYMHSLAKLWALTPCAAVAEQSLHSAAERRRAPHHMLLRSEARHSFITH